jgi:hypothetical protein
MNKKNIVMNENRISYDLSDEWLNQVLQKLDEINNMLPVHLTLTDDERQGGFKLGDKGIGFLEKGKDYMKQAPQFSPGYLDMDETLRDANFSVKMNTVSRKIKVLQTLVEDLVTIAGMEALAGILSYYRSVKNAAKDGVPGAKPIYEDLKKRFPGPTGEKESSDTVNGQ